MNQLYFGDNLPVLRNYFADESVDLIYLDPPFNSQATYNVLFKSTAGEKSRAQIEAFGDTWHWGEEAELAFDGVIHSGNSDAAEMLRSMRSFLKENDMMAYLAMMAVRLIELHRVLKPTGSIYLHCDPTASHYLKLVMDAVFGVAYYRNEIVWKRTTTHSDSRTWSRVADVIFFYTKGPRFTWKAPKAPHSEDYIRDKYRFEDGDGRLYQLDNMTSPNPRPRMMYEWRGFPHPAKGWRFSEETMSSLDEQGLIWYPKKDDGSFDTTKRPRFKRYLDQMPGGAMGTIWTDIPPINSQAQERLGYPTQKPLALLERIISASSDEGDLVLDPFCGCGTTVHAAQKLKRRWVGIDITHLAISLIEKRLKDAFPGIKYEPVIGRPKDLAGARELAYRDKHQFQLWAGSCVNAVPFRSGKKGADSGIDGLIYFKPEGKATEKAIVSVKGGEHVDVSMIRDLGHVVDRENARIGVFITLSEPTAPMRKEAVKAGFYQTLYGKYPKIQILTIQDLFEGKQPDIPLVDPSAFKKAAKEIEGGEQNDLPF